jgi:hypothetical protein
MQASRSGPCQSAAPFHTCPTKRTAASGHPSHGHTRLHSEHQHQLSTYHTQCHACLLDSIPVHCTAHTCGRLCLPVQVACGLLEQHLGPRTPAPRHHSYKSSTGSPLAHTLCLAAPALAVGKQPHLDVRASHPAAAAAPACVGLYAMPQLWTKSQPCRCCCGEWPRACHRQGTVVLAASCYCCCCCCCCHGRMCQLSGPPMRGLVLVGSTRLPIPDDA